jgi:hypothetical protein
MGGFMRWDGISTYRFRPVLISLFLLMTAFLLNAQTPGTGAISGKVLDPTGAVVPGASVSIESEETKTSRKVRSSSLGTFVVPLLAPGDYSVTIEADGFRREVLPAIHVIVTETSVVNVKLVLGSVATNLEIIESPELAQTESAALGRAIESQVITALPLANRNFTQILALSPGALVELPNAANIGRNSQNISVNGAKTTANNFQFNGIDANNLSENSASGFVAEVGLAIPAPDTIAEFKVQTGQYDAAYGRGSGANVDLVSKTGTNRFHGSAWEFFRNDALNANDFFLKQNNQPRPVLKQNQFGFTFGGPIRKDKTFFFSSYQGTTQIDGDSNLSLQTAFLPPLTNDRSAAALGRLFGGQSGAFGGVAVAPDGSNINPAALALLNFKLPDGSYAVPTPQTILPTSIGESTFSIPARYHEHQFTLNIDHNLRSQDQLAGRFFYSRAPTQEPFSPFASNVPGWGTNELDQNLMFVLSETHSFSSNLINVARAGFMRFHGSLTSQEPITGSSVGIQTPSGLPVIPGIQVNGLFTIGPSGEATYLQNTNTFVWQDTVSLTSGKHNIRLGGEAKRHQLDVDVPFVNVGFLFIQSFPDFLLGQSASQNGSGFSNILQSVAASGIFRKDERYTDFAGFVQDDFRATPWLTLNAGLRYEYFGPPVEINGRLSNFDPSIATLQVPAGGSFSGFVLSSNYPGQIPAGVTRASTADLWNPDYKDWSPRFGFALRLHNSPTLVLRGGYGIYYERLSGELAEQNIGKIPFAFTQMLQGAQNAAATLQQPFVPSLPSNSAFPIFTPRTPDGALTIASTGRDLRSPATQQYDLNLQYEFLRNTLWEIGYVGSTTAHLTGCSQFNQALIATPQNPIGGQTTTTNENIASRLPFEGIASGAYICGTTFNANYNSLQTTVSRRLNKHLDMQASYTWSRTLDYTSGTGELSSLDLGFLGNDQNNLRSSYGPADFDRTHRFVASFSYTPPNLKRGPAVIQKVLSDWQFAGVGVLQSGVPITVLDSGAGSVFGNLVFTNRAQCTGQNPASSGSLFHRLNGFFDPAAFANAPTIGDGTGFGNCGVGILRGPGQRNLDMGIHRTFSLAEARLLEFRTEFFNVTNTPSFGLPLSDRAAGPGFGVISSTVSNPRLVQLALKLSF